MLNNKNYLVFKGFNVGKTFSNTKKHGSFLKLFFLYRFNITRNGNQKAKV